VAVSAALLLSVKLVIGRGAGSRATEPILDASR